MDIQKKVISIIVDQLGVKKDIIKLESSFINDLGADSMDIVELIMAFEDDFSITIPDQEENNIKTVQDAINFIKNNS